MTGVRGSATSDRVAYGVRAAGIALALLVSTLLIAAGAPIAPGARSGEAGESLGAPGSGVSVPSGPAPSTPSIRDSANFTASIRLVNGAPQVGRSEQLSAVVTGGSGSNSCHWSFQSGGTATGCNVTHTWSTAGTYVVTVTVEDSEGANATATSLLEVGPGSGGSFPTGWAALVGPAGAILLVGVVLLVVVAVIMVRRGRRPGPPSPREAEGTDERGATD